MAGYQSIPYTTLHELLDTLANRSRTIETQTKKLSEKLRFFGTSQDTRIHRTRLDEDEKRLETITIETKSLSGKLLEEIKKRKKEFSKTDLVKVENVQTAISTAFANYEAIVKEIGAARKRFPNPSDSTLIDFGDDDEDDQNRQQYLQTQRQIRADNERLRKENEEQFAIEEQIIKVHDDIVQINQIMRDITTIVTEATPIIRNIENQIETTNDNILSANSRLASAAGHQKSYRKKLCCILIAAFVAAVILTIILVIKLR